MSASLPAPAEPPAPAAPPAPATPLAIPSRRRTAVSVALLGVLYLWVFPYFAQVNNPNENVRVYMTVSIVDDHTFAINRLHDQPDWGYVNDKSVRNGRLYSSKAPGSSYFGVPAYWVLTRLTGRDSRPLTPAQVRAHHRPPLERTTIVYWLRLWSNVVPALFFAWFWHRFLGRYTTVPALREAVFFSTMAGSLLFAYTQMFASHSQNALCAMGALMAVATVRRRDSDGVTSSRVGSWSLGLMFVTGLLGAGATMFEYPAAVSTLAIALIILATASERRWWLALVALPLLAVSVVLFMHTHTGPGAAAVVRRYRIGAVLVFALAAAAYGMTLTWRSVARLAAAGLGAVPPTFLVLFYHARCFGSPWKPGYSYLENPQFHAETSQGFFGATTYSWEAGVRMWFDPAFGMMPGTAIFLAAVLGLGAYFSWRPPAHPKLPAWSVWVVRGVLGLLAMVCLVKIAALVPVIRTTNWVGPRTAEMSWVGILAVVLVLLASVSLPRPVHWDPALGAVMMLSAWGLTRLIGAMNNWRGGWQVGPRYLATIVPMLGLLALVGLDALARGSASRRRAVTIFAGGATVHSMLVSGLPGAYFPHIPTEFVSPTFELFMPLLRAGVVPHNAGRYLFHSEGLRSMLPFFAAAAAIAVMLLRGDERRPVPIASHVFASMAVFLVLLAPIAATAKYEQMGVTRFVRGVWEPRPRNEVRPAPAPVANESRDRAIARGRALDEAGDPTAAFEAFRAAARRSP